MGHGNAAIAIIFCIIANLSILQVKPLSILLSRTMKSMGTNTEPREIQCFTLTISMIQKFITIHSNIFFFFFYTTCNNNNTVLY